MTDDERRLRLISWLETICRDTQDLLVDSRVFWEMQDVISGNPALLVAPALLKQWMASCFAQATAVGVRRQVKSGSDSVSLMRLLREVRQFPHLVSRQHYLSLFAGCEDWLVASGHRDFDRIVGPGADAMPSSVVDSQISDLSKAARRIEHYVDRRIAHYDKRGMTEPAPTFDDLKSSLRTIDCLLVLYWQLLKGSSMDTVEPVLQEEWQSILLFPWIHPQPGDDATD